MDYGKIKNILIDRGFAFEFFSDDTNLLYTHPDSETEVLVCFDYADVDPYEDISEYPDNLQCKAIGIDHEHKIAYITDGTIIVSGSDDNRVYLRLDDLKHFETALDLCVDGFEMLNHMKKLNEKLFEVQSYLILPLMNRLNLNKVEFQNEFGNESTVLSTKQYIVSTVKKSDVKIWVTVNLFSLDVRVEVEGYVSDGHKEFNHEAEDFFESVEKHFNEQLLLEAEMRESFRIENEKNRVGSI